MTDFNQTVVLDGMTDFSIFGRQFSWDDGFIARLRTRLEDGDTGAADLILRGDLEIEVARFNGTPAAAVDIREDGTGDRFIKLLRLPDGRSTVDLSETEANIIRGFGTAGYDLSLGRFVEHVRLGDGPNAIDLAAGFDGLVFGSGSNRVTFDADAFGGSITAFSEDDSVNSITVAGGARVRSIGLSQGRDTLLVDASSSVEQAQLGNNDDSVTIRTGARIDSLQLGSGNDRLLVDGGRSNQTIAYDGNDVVRLVNEARIDSLTLGGGSNRLEVSGGSEVQQFLTYDGDDTVRIADGRVSTMSLGSGDNDVVTGDRFVQGIFAFDGNDDVTVGTGGAGTVKLDQGNNTVVARGFVDHVVLFDGRDAVTIREGARGVGLGDGNNTLVSLGFVGRITSGDGADRLTVAGGAADLNSGAGDDVLRLGLNSVSSAFAGDGNDLIQVGLLEAGEFVEVSGGAGFDTIDMSRVGGDLDIDLRRRWNDQGENGFFAITDMEAAIGGDGNDRIAGDMQDNRLTGGDGNDVFVFDRLGGSDVITDFVVGEDLIRLDGIQSASQVGIARDGDGVRLDYFDTSILVADVTVGQLAQVSNFEL